MVVIGVMDFWIGREEHRDDVMCFSALTVAVVACGAGLLGTTGMFCFC